MPSTLVGTQVKGCAVHVPALRVPTLKSLTKVNWVAPGARMLNWNVSGPALVSVAVVVQVMVFPIGSGGFCDGAKVTRLTVAKAGALRSEATHKINKTGKLKIFMKFILADSANVLGPNGRPSQIPARENQPGILGSAWVVVYVRCGSVSNDAKYKKYQRVFEKIHR